MKKFMPIFMLCACYLVANGQNLDLELKDDLFPKKREIFARYFPYGEDDFLFKYYTMPVEEVRQKLASAKAVMLTEASKIGDAELRLLVEKDIDFICRDAIHKLQLEYGKDSLGIENFNKVVVEKSRDPYFEKIIAEAWAKAYIKKLSPEVRNQLQEEVFKSAELDNFGLFSRSAAYRRWIDYYVTHLSRKYKSGTLDAPLLKLKVVKAEIPTGLVKDHLIFTLTEEVLKLVKDSSEKERAYQYFMTTARSREQMKVIESIYANNKMMTGNAISPDFSFTDVNGKLVSLRSLRGKYVYIDVWATWCVPCKLEIPHLQKIEHDYASKNIHFVSLSADRMIDKNKWLSYVKQHKLGGIQLIADRDFNSEFIKQYNIASIPRFILIDPQGRIVSGDAYRPSDPKLRDQLDKLLR